MTRTEQYSWDQPLHEYGWVEDCNCPECEDKLALDSDEITEVRTAHHVSIEDPSCTAKASDDFKTEPGEKVYTLTFQAGELRMVTKEKEDHEEREERIYVRAGRSDPLASHIDCWTRLAVGMYRAAAKLLGHDHILMRADLLPAGRYLGSYMTRRPGNRPCHIPDA